MLAARMAMLAYAAVALGYALSVRSLGRLAWWQGPHDPARRRSRVALGWRGATRGAIDSGHRGAS